MHSLVVSLRITPEEYQRVYSSYVRQVRAVATNGQTVRFPISILQRYLTRDGIRGTFQLSFDEHHKLKSIQQIA